MRDDYVPVADGVRLHVREAAGGGRPFLLVHGLASNARTWDGVAARLAAAGHRAVAVDLRGHGESDAPPAGYDTLTAAADLAALSAALGLDAPVVAGQSWGGNVVLQLAADRPGLASAVAAVDGGWIHLRDAFGTWEECLARLTPPDFNGVSAPALAARLRAAHPAGPRAASTARSRTSRSTATGRSGPDSPGTGT